VRGVLRAAWLHGGAVDLLWGVCRKVKELLRLQWATTQGVEDLEVLPLLTEDLQRDLRRRLCVDLLTVVRPRRPFSVPLGVQNPLVAMHPQVPFDNTLSVTKFLAVMSLWCVWCLPGPPLGQ